MRSERVQVACKQREGPSTRRAARWRAGGRGAGPRGSSGFSWRPFFKRRNSFTCLLFRDWYRPGARECWVTLDSLRAPWTVASQAPLPRGFSRLLPGAGCHFLLQGSSPSAEQNSALFAPLFPALAGGFFTCALHLGSLYEHIHINKKKRKQIELFKFPCLELMLGELHLGLASTDFSVIILFCFVNISPLDR